MSRSVKPAMPSPFWRDAALPFIEARTVDELCTREIPVGSGN
ncbi:hypothetical protein [Burkholderia stagnalis]|nr:hypothetical protein [Burkholderia stagnalis]